MQQVVQAAIEQQVLRAAQEVESQIDAELHKLETLDDDDIERLRQKRIDELKRWVRHGRMAGPSASGPPPAAAAAHCPCRRCPLPMSPLPACRLQQKRQEWAQKGHGEYNEIEEKEFFKVKSEDGL